jgi:hypothetical protein
MKQGKHALFLLSLFFVLACPGAFAQANSTVTGIVADQTGAIVAGAKIALINPATNTARTTVSDSTGLYVIAGVNPATYNMKVTANGFETFANSGIVVNISATVRSDVKLTVGAESQTVTVEADALTVQTDSNMLNTLIDGQQISEIATENRNLLSLVSLGLGVSSDMPDNNTPVSVSANTNLSVNGLRRDHNLYMIDGGESDDRGGGGSMAIMPSQDAIAEFQVLASNYPPDYGIASGATVIMSIKSGTQKFHGELYEEDRNTDFDANSYFNKLSTPVIPRSPTHYNIFGGNVGGPAEIPHLYNTDRRKTFFFWSEEWRKIATSAGTNDSPTLDISDFPAAGTDLKYVAPLFSPGNTIVVPITGDPAFTAKLTALGLIAGQPFPNNTIPQQLFDPNAVAYLNSGIVPKPNASGDYAITTGSDTVQVRDDIVRGDHKINDKWQLMGEFLHDEVLEGYPTPSIGWSAASYDTVSSTLNTPSASGLLKVTGAIRPSILVEGGIYYDGNELTYQNTSNRANKPSSWSVVPFFNTGNAYVPSVSFGTPYSTGMDMGSTPWHNAGGDLEEKVDLSYTQGKHAMKFGFSYNHYVKNQQIGGETEGAFSVGALSNDSIMDMLMGLTTSYSQLQNAWIGHYVNHTPSVYAMDTWHVTPRLSLQLGLRYDAMPLAWERNNRTSNFYPDSYLSTQVPDWNTDGSLNSIGPGFQKIDGVSYYMNGMAIAGQNGIPKSMVNSDYKTLQPRVGFSEDLFGNGRTVLRGGFGMFYERLTGNAITDPATNPPFAFDPGSSNVYFSSPSTSWVTGQTASTPTYPASITYLAQPYHSPAVAEFSLGVQHELTPSVIWVVQYAGNLAWHQDIQDQINNFPLTTNSAILCDDGDPSNHYAGDTCGSSLANANIYRTYQGYGTITAQVNNTNANYNGFQTGLRVQNRWGLSGEINYTWSHEIDLTSSELTTVDNPWNLKYDKGSGLLDRRQIFNANYVYNLPLFAKRNSLTHAVAGGWEVAGTINDETGLIATPFLNINYDPVGLGSGYANRPNVNGKTHYMKKFGEWFDTSQFSAPIPSWAGGPNLGFGNAGKDSIVTPGRVNFTTSLYKSFAINERAHFELRFESFNTFNHTQFNGLSTNLGSGNFGQVTSTWDPRVLELGGKFVF